jgi:DNA-directed RNA polymerase alpha subunit
MKNEVSLLNDMRLQIIRDQIERIYKSEISDKEKINLLIPSFLDMTRIMVGLQTSNNSEVCFKSQSYEDKKERVDILKSQNLSGDLKLLLDKPIHYLGFKIRTYNLLKFEGIEYVGDLAQKSSYYLLEIPDLGKKTLKEIEETLKNYKISLDMNFDNWERPAF